MSNQRNRGLSPVVPVVLFCCSVVLVFLKVSVKGWEVQKHPNSIKPLWVLENAEMMNWRINLSRFFSLLFLTASLFVASACAQSPTSPTVSGKISGNFNCEISNKEQETSEKLHVVFGITDGVVIKFSSSWVLSSDSPDLRPGYGTTCEIDLNELQQINRSGDVILKLRPGRHERGQESCEIKIQDSQSSIQVNSSGCSYSCLALNISIDKGSGVCRRTIQK